VLEPSAIVPAENLTTVPKTFTHVLRKTQPYYYEPGADVPDGSLTAGLRVRLLDHDGELAWVVDGQGLRVATAYEGLRRIGTAKDAKSTTRAKHK
jgi:hypothetical protein